MTDNISAEIIAIGTEILLGEITDTNSVYLAQVLRDYGINVYFMTSVGDNVQRIASAVTSALGRADVVITCGGLGPTVDDMTRQGIADATHRPLVFDESLLQQIEARFATFKTKMSANNRRQAYLPQGALVIENPVGTAPSFITPVGEKIIITLPGVPRELKYLMQQTVVPYLQSHYKLGLIRARILRAGGIGESALDEMIGDEILTGNNPTVGLAAHHGVIDVRITAKAATAAEADAMLDDHEQRLRERVEKYIFGYGKDTIEAVCTAALLAAGEKVAIVEAGLTGLVRNFQAIPDYAEAVPVLDDYDTPEQLYDAYHINSGTSYRDAAEQIAVRLATDYGNALIIISDPTVDEGSDSGQATVVTLYSHGEMLSRSYGFGAQSELAQGWVSRWGLANLWRLLKGSTS